jgi:hypothetical protein
MVKLRILITKEVYSSYEIDTDRDVSMVEQLEEEKLQST